MKITNPPKPCGTIGGIIFKPGPGSTIAQTGRRTRKTRSLRQQVINKCWQGLAYTWTLALTDAEREAYDDYAANIAETTGGCAAVELNGYQWWQRMQLALKNAHTRQQDPTPINETAPTTADRGGAAPTVTALKVVDNFARFEGTKPATADATELIIIYMSAPVDPGRDIPGDPWPFAMMRPASGAATTWGFTGGLPPASGLFVATVPGVGQDVGVKVVRLRADGRISVPRIARITTVAF